MTSAITAAGIAPARMVPTSFSARPVTISVPYPPPPMNAASVAVPTVRTAEVLTPAMIVTEASGSSIQARRRQLRSPRTVVISTSRGSRVLIPACVLRTIGSRA